MDSLATESAEEPDDPHRGGWPGFRCGDAVSVRQQYVSPLLPSRTNVIVYMEKIERLTREL